MGLFSGIALVCVEFLEWVLMGFCYGWVLMVWVCRRGLWGPWVAVFFFFFFFGGVDGWRGWCSLDF